MTALCISAALVAVLQAGSRVGTYWAGLRVYSWSTGNGFVAVCGVKEEAMAALGMSAAHVAVLQAGSRVGTYRPWLQV